MSGWIQAAMQQNTIVIFLFRYGDTAPCYSSAKMLEDNLNESLHCEDFKEWTYSIDDVDGSAVIRHHGIKLTQDPEKKDD